MAERRGKVIDACAGESREMDEADQDSKKDGARHGGSPILNCFVQFSEPGWRREYDRSRNAPAVKPQDAILAGRQA